MDSELNEEEEDTLLLKAYTGHFDQLHNNTDEPVINIDFSEGKNTKIKQLKEDKTIKINKKLQYIPEEVKEYFIKIESIKETIIGTDINDFGDKDSSFRYFSLTCHKCGSPGHFSVECPNKNFAACYLCGEQHLSRECPNQICFKCFTPGHLRRDCKLPQAPRIACIRCSKTGHNPTECPRYFNFDDKEIYCYNCGYEGHAGPTCSEFSADILFDALKKNTTPVNNSKDTKTKNGSNKKKRKSTSSSDGKKKKSAKKKKRKSH